MKLNLRCPDDLLAGIRARGAISDSIRTGLERYYDLLARSRATIRETLTDPELSLLADVCNGTIWEPWSVPLIAANIEDSEPATFAKWGADRDALLSKLAALTLTDYAALVDAIERFWAAVGTGIPVDPARLLD